MLEFRCPMGIDWRAARVTRRLFLVGLSSCDTTDGTDVGLEHGRAEFQSNFRARKLMSDDVSLLNDMILLI